jgi:membrane protein required for colicin V production
MVGTLTYLDVGVIALCAISGLLAMYRGLVREVLSIVSWVLAAAATAYFLLFHKDVAKSAAEGFFQNEMLAQFAIGVLIFVVVLILVHFITIRISDTVLESRIGMIDRVFGLAFGIARGYLLVAIALAGLTYLLGGDKAMPDWVAKSQTLPYIQPVSVGINELANQMHVYLGEKLGEDSPLSPGGGEGAPAEEAPSNSGQSG